MQSKTRNRKSNSSQRTCHLRCAMNEKNVKKLTDKEYKEYIYSLTGGEKVIEPETEDKN